MSQVQTKLLLELHTLGWRNFQDLSGEILRHVLGQTFKVFPDSNDGGRDGAFYGIWQENILSEHATGIAEGATVLQCKFISKTSSTLSLSDVSDEIEKIEKLADKGLCGNYILMTNARVTGKSEEKIIKSIKEAGAERVFILDGDWICKTIIENQTLRLYVPRVYGLGDLSQIIDTRAYQQAKELLDQLEGLATFVITKPYVKAAEAIHSEGFVLLLGEPSSGKSVIAATLAMASADKWNSLVVRIQNAAEFKQHWNPNEPNQFFWIDDAFGAVRHDEVLTDAWSKHMPEVMSAIKKGAKVVMTSRDYIYRQAKTQLKEYAFPLLKESQVVINVNELSNDEKQRILYNHIKLGNQNVEFKKQIKPFLVDVSSVRKFLPEVARRLGNHAFTKHLDPLSRSDVREFMENPKHYLIDVFGQLDETQKASLALVYKYVNLESPISKTIKDRDLLIRFGTSIDKVQASLTALKNTFLRYSETKKAWSFHHPTLREGYASYIMREPELVDILLDGFELSTLLDSVDCGKSPSTKGQLIHIPERLYEDIIDRVKDFYSIYAKTDAYNRYLLRTKYFEFLKRASELFIQQLYKTQGEQVDQLILQSLHGSILGNSAITFAVYLKETGLLKESVRLKIVSYFSEASVAIPDSNWATWTPAKSLLTDEEYESIEKQVRIVLISNLEDTIDDWEMNENSEIDGYYEELKSVLEEYSLIFFDDSTAQILIDDGKRRIEDLEEEMAKKQQREEDSLYEDDHPTQREILQTRNIFDDIDK